MIPYDVPLWIVLIFLFVLGCTFGSFLNVCIYRIPQHEAFLDQLKGLWSPPSHCPKCGYQLTWRDNIPVLSWLLLRGRCRSCRRPISFRYPFVEVLNGVLWVVLFWMEIPAGYAAKPEESCLFAKLGPQILDGFSPVLHLNLRFWYHLVLVEALVVASLIDWDLQIIPDGSTLPAMCVGVLAGAIGYVHLVPVWFQSPLFSGAFNDLLPRAWQLPPLPDGIPRWVFAHPHLHGLAVSVAGIVVGGGVVWGVRIVGTWILRREAMGLGDVILVATIGAFLGWQATVMVFFTAPLCALVTVLISLFFKRQREIPYGPYLSLAALVNLLFFRQVWPFWERIFQSGLLVPLMFLAGGVLLAASLALTQLIKKALGIPLYDQEQWYEEWTSADQLGYQYSENHDRYQGRWRQTEWPGVGAGQGTRSYQTWRNGPG